MYLCEAQGDREPESGMKSSPPCSSLVSAGAGVGGRDDARGRGVARTLRSWRAAVPCAESRHVWRTRCRGKEFYTVWGFLIQYLYTLHARGGSTAAYTAAPTSFFERSIQLSTTGIF